MKREEISLLQKAPWEVNTIGPQITYSNLSFVNVYFDSNLSYYFFFMSFFFLL